MNPVSAEKVVIELYYETLCPYSAKFITNQLPTVFYNGLIGIVALQLGEMPFSNQTTFECQHGAFECLLNTIHACAISTWPSVKERFPFILCGETTFDGNHTQWKSCFKVLALDPKPVLDCHSSGYGKKLELKYAVETASLRPPHEYVPWLVVNGRPLYEDIDNFIHYICKAYRGSLPTACKCFKQYQSCPSLSSILH